MSKKCQMSKSICEAFEILNKMRDNAERYGKGSYFIERIEQAMDYLLNDPTKVGIPRILVRDAMGNAGVKIRHRINILNKTTELAGVDSIVTMSLEENSNLEHQLLETLDEIQRATVDEHDKVILLSLCYDKSTKELAEEQKVSVGTMTTRISRARTKFLKSLVEAI